MPIAIIGYSSISAIAFMVSDVKKPDVTVPKSMFISISIVIGIYFLVITATLGLITAGYLIENEKMRFIPLFAACFTKLQNIPFIVAIVSIASVVALLTTMIVCVSMNSRALQASSFDGMLPSLFGKSNKNGVPAFAAFITCLFSAIVASFPNITQQIVNFGAIFNVFTIVITLFSLVFARHKFPDKNKAFKTPGGEILISIILIILILCNTSSIILGGKDLLLFTLALWGVGILIYLLRGLWNKDSQKGQDNDSCD